MKPALLTLIALTISACSPQQTLQENGPSRLEDKGCEAEGAREWIGQHISTVPSAYSDPDFADVRLIYPGTPYTKDLRPARLNMILDASGVVQDAYCG